jgi:hypothetical protein
MTNSKSNTRRRTVPVDPEVHVETFATHHTLTWKAGDLSQFVTAIHAVDPVTPTTPTIVNDTAIAGRQQHPLSDTNVESTTIEYLRIEPDAPWTLSWEQRTFPVVSLSGTPPATLCRRIHLRTTDCSTWSDEAFEILRQLTSDPCDETL